MTDRGEAIFKRIILNPFFISLFKFMRWSYYFKNFCQLETQVSFNFQKSNRKKTDKFEYKALRSTVCFFFTSCVFAWHSQIF